MSFLHFNSHKSSVKAASYVILLHHGEHDNCIVICYCSLCVFSQVEIGNVSSSHKIHKHSSKTSLITYLVINSEVRSETKLLSVLYALSMVLSIRSSVSTDFLLSIHRKGIILSPEDTDYSQYFFRNILLVLASLAST